MFTQSQTRILYTLLYNCWHKYFQKFLYTYFHRCLYAYLDTCLHTCFHTCTNMFTSIITLMFKPICTPILMLLFIPLIEICIQKLFFISAFGTYVYIFHYVTELWKTTSLHTCWTGSSFLVPILSMCFPMLLLF